MYLAMAYFGGLERWVQEISGAFEQPPSFPVRLTPFATASKLISSGKRTDPITLKPFFENAEAINGRMTVPQYLGSLAINAPRSSTPATTVAPSTISPPDVA
jgi:hypothetical protein